MNGKDRAKVTKIAAILGTKVSVISWICVKAWKNAITKPTAKATIRTGADEISVVMMVCRITS